jgi:hypothetical protein
MAVSRQLGALTYRVFADGPLATAMPAPVRERLRGLYVGSAVRNALLLRQSAKAVAALAARGIPVILLKGIHLCRFVYPEPGLRSMADVDLMVPRDRLAEAERVFVDAGWGPEPRADVDERCAWSNHLAKLHRANEPVLELHWTIERPTAPFGIDLDGIWGRARPATFEGVEIRVLCPEDLLLHLALHASFHHGFGRAAFKAVVDVAAVIHATGDAMDWDQLVARANAWGAGGYAYTTVRVVADVMRMPVPMSVLERLRHDAEDLAMVDIARRFIIEPELPTAYRELARQTGVWERWKTILRHAYPPRDEMERIYGLRPGAPVVYLHYLGRLPRLLARRSRMLLWALLRRDVGDKVRGWDQARRRIETWIGHPVDRDPGPSADAEG